MLDASSFTKNLPDENIRLDKIIPGKLTAPNGIKLSKTKEQWLETTSRKLFSN